MMSILYTVSNTQNISNQPVVDQHGQMIGYQLISIDPTLRQRTLMTYNPNSLSNTVYSGPVYNRTSVSGLLIGIFIIIIGLIILAIIWLTWWLSNR